MQLRAVLGIPFFFLSALIACSAGPIVVREAANCSGNDMYNSDPVPLHEGDTFQAEKTLSSGPGGRIQLDYGSGLVRVGARSSLRLKDDGQIDLRDGAFLFQNVSGKEHLTVSTPSREIRISGNTGFIRVDHSRDANDTIVAIGALSGELQVQNGTKTYKLAPADLVVVSAAGAVARQQFDLQKQMSSSRLLSGFNSKLRDPAVLASAQHNFLSLRKRGFFRSPDLLSEQRNPRLVAGSSLLADARERHVASQASILPAQGPAAAAPVSFTPVKGFSTLSDSSMTLQPRSSSQPPRGPPDPPTGLVVETRREIRPPTPLQLPSPPPNPPTYYGFRQILPPPPHQPAPDHRP